ncbi:MAG: class I SAM-dependent methyltransferase [Planctomycetota bacterium]|jgi:16S rRNA (guanine1516-N2)-methyltransferase
MRCCRALADAELAPILAGRLEVVEGDARTVLPALAPPPDVVYVDPMYPPKRKRSALPPKPIVIVRRLVGPDEDAGELLSVARRVALRRVVVKRPPWAPPLSDDAVASHAGKLARYDVFRPSPG